MYSSDYTQGHVDTSSIRGEFLNTFNVQIQFNKHVSEHSNIKDLFTSCSTK